LGGDARSVKEKKVAALFAGTGPGRLAKVTVIVPPTNAFVIDAEKMRVRTPLVPEPLVTSASLVYVLRALSLTVTPVVDGSMATVTKTVFIVLSVLPAATVAGVLSVVSDEDSLKAVPMFVGV
jgi:hypothetical protein